MAPVDASSDDEDPAAGAGQIGAPNGVVVLEPEDEERLPTDEEVLEYAEYLGINPQDEPHLMWIAKEGVTAPVPHPWKACTENGDDVFYFNFESGESLWDHPSDEIYRNMVEEERKKHAGAGKGAGNNGADTKKANDSASELAMKDISLHSLQSNSSPSRLNESDAARPQADDSLNDDKSEADESVSVASPSSKSSKDRGDISMSMSSPKSIGAETEDQHRLSFKDLDWKDIDQGSFKSELRDSLQKSGVPNAELEKIQIELREGSDTAILRGPSSAISAVEGVAPEKIKVMGSQAVALPKFADKAEFVPTGCSPGGLVKDFSPAPASSADESFSGASASSPKGRKEQVSASLEESSLMSPPLPSSAGSPSPEPKNSFATTVQTPATPEKGLAGVGLAGALGATPSPNRLEVPRKEKSASASAGSGSASHKSGRSGDADEIEEEDWPEASGSASQSGAHGHSGSGPGGGLPRPVGGAPVLDSHRERERPDPLALSGSGGRGLSSASELSDDLDSVLGTVSPTASQQGHANRGRGDGSWGAGDTLELSVSAAADFEEHGPVAAAAEAAMATTRSAKANGMDSSLPLEAKISSLTRSLGMLKEIRKNQRQYLELLLGSAGSA
eukprot:TRINITY_DN62826_c0_g1_i1.p1 TRINITY_DN62826_c0_g1~~TRINITY_DN62826_c0_g1_i1.p1  ORF type:complete len:620 (+),score=132.05 TRINITY_DN62826_c0_g1_i1:39-1898(+)